MLVLVCGCDKLFDLSHVDDQPMRDASRDSPADVLRPLDAPVDGLVQTHSNCPPNFSQAYANSQYRYFSGASSWSQALLFCKNLDDPTSTKRVHLSVITDDIERTHIYVDVVGSASEFWIGLSDLATEGTYRWVTAELVQYPIMSAWAAGEPSADIADDCVRVQASNTNLDSLPCATLIPFVCECDDYPNEPANYTP